MISGKGADDTSMCVSTMDAFLNLWFTDYEEARAAREREGGYLFPYRHQFFVPKARPCVSWGSIPIGWDWARPVDGDAWARLKAKRDLAR